MGHCDPNNAVANSCTMDQSCWFDYTDFTEDGNVIYQEKCQFAANHKPIYKCKDLSQEAMWDFGACEQKILAEKVEEILDEIFEKGGGSYLKLGRDEPCNYELEQVFKEAFAGLELINGYKFLKYVTKSSGDAGFCDSTRLLECKKDTQKCECVDGTKPRISDDGLYKSYYCYLFKRFSDCATDVTDLLSLPVLPIEKNDMYSHYGHPDEFENCYGNVCLFVQWWGICTDENTGKTGAEGDKPPPPPPPEVIVTVSTGSPFGTTAKPRPQKPPPRPLAPPTRYSGAMGPPVALNWMILMAIFLAFRYLH